MNIKELVCKNLLHLRKKNRYTQEDLSRILGGMGRSNYAKLERGEVYLTVDRAAKLAAFYEVSLDDFVYKDLSNPENSLHGAEESGPIYETPVRVPPLKLEFELQFNRQTTREADQLVKELLILVKKYNLK